MVEAKLNKAVSDGVPDVLDKVLSECKPQDERITSLKSVRKSHGSLWPKVLATAAAIALVIGCVSFGGSPLAQPALAEGYCTILENGEGQGVVMEVGADGLVTGAKEIFPHAESPVIKPAPFSQAPQGAENVGTTYEKCDMGAIAALDPQALVGKPIEEAMTIAARALAGTSKGGPAEAFLISLISDTKGGSTGGEALVNKLMNAVSNATAANSGAVIAQSLSNTQELERAAGKNGVSLGKQSFMDSITKAAAKNGLKEFDRLSNFDLNTLAVLAGGLLDKLPDTKVNGVPDSSAFVGVESAIKACVLH